MTDRDALVAAIAAAPADDLPRLVFADWLEENGDPAQAAFIRKHIELTRMKPGTPNRQKLAEEVRAAAIRHAAEWVAPLCAAFGQPPPEWPPEPTRGWLRRLWSRPVEADALIQRPYGPPDCGWLAVPCTARGESRVRDSLGSVQFRRGMPERLTVLVPHVRAGVAGDAFRLAPVLELVLYKGEAPDGWDRLAGPWLSGVRGLELWPGSPEAADPVFRSPHLTGVRAVTVGPGPAADGPQPVQTLSRSPLADRLRALRVPLLASTVRDLHDYPAGSPLQELRLNPFGYGLTPDQWRGLADLPFRPTLKRLSLANCYLTHDALGALCRGPRWDSLVALRLDSNLFADGGGVTLARLAPFPKLQALRLDRSGLADDAARALARSPLVRTLRFLDLSYNQITADGALPLAVALAEGPLRRLRLGGNAITRRRRYRIRDILRDRVALDP